LDFFGDLAEALDDRVGVNVAQQGVIPGLTFGLCHQVLPRGVAGKQVPLLPSVLVELSKQQKIRNEMNNSER
jgi:hypothetical protein